MKDKKPNKLKGYKGLRRLIPYYKRNSKNFTIFIILLAFVPATGMLAPIFTANSIAALTELQFESAFYCAMLLLGVKLLSFLVGYLRHLLYTKVDLDVLYNLKKDLNSAITAVTMTKNDKTNSGVYIDRIANDVNRCSDVILDLIMVSVELLTNLAFLVYIAFLNIWFFVIMLAYVVVLWFFDSKIEKNWFLQRTKYRSARDIATGTYTEQIRGIKDIKSLNIRKNTIEDSSDKYGKALEYSKKSWVTRASWRYVRSIFACIFEVGFIVLGIVLIRAEIISLAGFFVVFIYHSNVKMVSQYVASIKQYATEGEISAQRVFDVIDSYPKEAFGEKVLEGVKGHLELKDVSFEYEENKPVLKGVNLLFEPNTTTAIVGKSGSGKSTILSLVNKLYVVEKGKVLIDGIDITELTEDSLRDNIGTVTQNPYIFNRTIRENMLLVKPKATEEEIIDALKRTQIYDFVKELELGIDSTVGENGIMLSGGQKQRLAIARLLLKDPKVIILDEATSSLDNENQNKIVEVIEDLKLGHTIIIVAHRLSTIVDADNIVVLDGGKVVGRGTHKQLMKESLVYKDLYIKEEKSALLNDAV